MDAHGLIIGSYPDIAFLSDDLLIVSINQRQFGPVQPSLTDQPPSTLLLFDISQQRLISSRSFPIEKEIGAVQAIGGGHFVLLNEDGIRACSADLSCGSALSTSGPLFVSPRGTRLVVGGNGKTSQEVIDTTGFKTLRKFKWGEQQVVPGDAGLLIRTGNSTHVVSGNRDVPLHFGGAGIWPQARFLSDSKVADFDFRSRALFVSDLDGNIAYKKPEKQPWEAEIVVSANGHDFAVHESGYTRLNSIVNFLDIDSGRPNNLETTSVFDVDSGRELLHLEWDPRPFVGYLSIPALSPGGKKIATIFRGHLEVFDVP